MDRRTFLAGTGVVLLVAPLAAEAQTAGKIPQIGLLTNGSPSARDVTAFEQGLIGLGYVEGKNITLYRRFAHGKSDNLPALAAELVRLRVNILIAIDPPSTLAVTQLTKTIPVVMRTSDDPVETGLVASLAHPGGNITGLYSLYEQLTPKRLELLSEAFPKVKRIAVLWDPSGPGARRVWAKTEAAAQALKLELQSVEASATDDFAPGFRAATNRRAGAMLTLRSPHMVRRTTDITRLAVKYRLPVMGDERVFVEAGGLMSYGANLADLHRRLALYVDKILKGAKPAELPVEQPTKFELVINLKTAKALGLTIPQSVLQRADEVIQ